MVRTAFGGTVRGVVIQATSNGVILKLTGSKEVRSIHAANLDPIKGPATRSLPGGRRKRVQPANQPVKAVKVKAAKTAKTTTPRVTVERVERDTRTDLQKYATILGGAVDRRVFADK